MVFYAVTYIFIGIAASSAYQVHEIRGGKLPIGLHPPWFAQSSKHELIIMLGAAAPILGIITSVFDQGFWVILAVIEIFFGYIASTFLLNVGIRNWIYITSPISLPYLFGALWGFGFF